MKTYILIVFLVTSFTGYSQEKSGKEQKKQNDAEEFSALTQVINKLEYTFEGSKALPTTGGAIDLTTNPNYLKIKGDSVYCSMPFFGRAYNVTPGEPGGFNFSGLYKNYKKEVNESKRRIDIKFQFTNTSDNYQFNITISGEESATLIIQSNKRASISYWGRIESTTN